MTTNIFSILNTAKLGLQTHQLGVEVTGHNIANVQTPGFSRQTVTLEPNTPRTVGNMGQIGTGVTGTAITRAHDQFLFKQILSENGTMGNFSVRRDVFDRLEILLNESTGTNLNNEMNQFFSALSDLAINPTGLPERTNVILAGDSLSRVFNTLGGALTQERTNLDARIEDEVNLINANLNEIVRLNEAIHGTETGNFSANDLRDQQDMLVKDLSEKLDINFITSSDGKMNLTLADGSPLVMGSQSFQLSTVTNPDNGGLLDVQITNTSGGLTNITNVIQGGEMRGLLDMRDVEVRNVQDQLDRLAASIITEVNRVHQQGLALDGTTGHNFFSAPTTTTQASVLNTGNGTVAVTNPSSTTTSTDKYQIQFTSSTLFNLVNQTTGQTVSTGNAFVSGTTFNLQGFGVTITNGGTLFAAGDTIDFSTSENAANTISVDTALANNPNLLAAGLTSTGDGDNALALSNLQTAGIFSGQSFNTSAGSADFGDFYNGILNGVGVGSRSAQTIAEQQEGVMLQLDIRRESTSGVSLDEEMINLIKFQQAFQASARLINVVDEMFSILQDRI